MATFVVEVAVNTALRTRLGRAIFDRRIHARHYDPAKDASDYTRAVFDTHWQACGQPRGGSVLELGPGGNVDAAAHFLEVGCDRVVCIDTVPYAEEADRRGVEYRTPEAIETTPLPDESFDVIYSHAVLEHVKDPERAVARMARLLRPGGVTSHEIDLRDHRDFSRPHGFLRYSERAWKAASSERPWPNRWRASDWEACFQRHGLETKLMPRHRVPVPPDQRVHASFAGKPDLDVVGLLLVAQKPPLRRSQLHGLSADEGSDSADRPEPRQGSAGRH